MNNWQTSLIRPLLPMKRHTKFISPLIAWMDTDKRVIGLNGTQHYLNTMRGQKEKKYTLYLGYWLLTLCVPQKHLPRLDNKRGIIISVSRKSNRTLCIEINEPIFFAFCFVLFFFCYCFLLLLFLKSVNKHKNIKLTYKTKNSKIKHYE